MRRIFRHPILTAGLLLALAVPPQSGSPQSGSPQSGSPQSGSQIAPCELLSRRGEERIEEARAQAAAARLRREETVRIASVGAAGGEATADPAVAAATLDLKRRQLALKAAETDRSIAVRACAEEAPATLDLVERHRIEELERQWAQLDCHRMGKELAIAEAEKERAAGSAEAAEAADVLISFYAPRIASCIESGRAAGEVRFPTADGGVVHAELRGVGERGVVLAHGGRFTKESWDEQAEVLADRGFRVLAIDFRGRGRSRGPDGADRGGEQHDVLAAVRYLRETGSTTVSVVGASFGGGAAAQAAVDSQPGEIDALVLLAHSVIEEPERMQGRKLFIVAEDDIRGGGVRRLGEIRRQLEAAPDPKRLLVLPGEAHAQFLFETDQAERLLEEIVEFIEAG